MSTSLPRCSARSDSLPLPCFLDNPLRLSPYLSLGNSNSHSQNPDSDSESTRIDYDGRLSAGTTIREYVDERTFLLADGNGRWFYSRRHWTTEPSGQNSAGGDQTSTTLRSDLRLDLRLGVGVGRVRVVTPVVRALRVRERLRAVAPGTSLSDEQVQKAARQLARRPGYQAVYDRSDKVFWRDFFNRVGAADRSPFETFYVADVLREPVGVRREGAEVQIGPSGSYSRNLQRTEEGDHLVNRNFFERGTVGAFLRGRWYRNVTLRHQLGIDVNSSYTHFVDSQGPLDHEIGFDAEGQWLWVLADRVRLDTRLRTLMTYRHDPLGGDAFRPQNRYSLSSDLRVFIENSLSLTAGTSLLYHYDGTFPDGPSTNFRTSVRVRMQYILSRALQ